MARPAASAADDGGVPLASSSAAGRLGAGAKPEGLRSLAWRRFRRDRVAMFGLAMTFLIAVFVLSAGLISSATGHDYAKGELGQQFLPPGSPGHLLGTDTNGRDVLVRLAYGGRVSLTVALVATFVTMLIGGGFGAVSGYFGGAVDGLMMRIVDVLLSIPGIPILILISVIYRPGFVGLAFVLALLGWPSTARMIRGEVLARRSSDYVDSARVVGATNGRILARHIIPNVVPLMVVMISLSIPGLILSEASLSFLGFGVRPPAPSWGNMLDGAQKYYAQSWTNVFIPGFMIWLTVLSINLIGNGVRDALDPRLRD
ncbi:MAG: ABC transporter permease [Chloroflexota bacterium]